MKIRTVYILVTSPLHKICCALYRVRSLSEYHVPTCLNSVQLKQRSILQPLSSATTILLNKQVCNKPKYFLASHPSKIPYVGPIRFSVSQYFFKLRFAKILLFRVFFWFPVGMCSCACGGMCAGRNMLTEYLSYSQERR
jgi:hypothetical protein